MKFSGLMLLLVLVIPAWSQSPPGIDWEMTYGGLEAEDIKGVLEVEDGFLCVGFTESSGAGLADLWLFKISERGDLLWRETYGGIDDDWGKSIIATQDGNYAIVGGNRYYAGAYGLWLLKVDGSGQLIWDQHIPGSYWDYAGDLAETPSGDLIIVGSTVVSSMPIVKVCRFDADGSLVYSRTYEDTDWGESVIAVSDDLCVVLASGPVAGSANDILVMALDGSGEIVWERNYGSHLMNDYASDICLLPDGGYLVSGSVLSNITGNSEDEIFRLDENGLLIWEYTYGMPSSAYHSRSCTVTPWGDFLIAGLADNTVFGFQDIYLLETDSTGLYQWRFDHGTSEYLEDVIDMAFTSTNRIIMAAFTETEHPWNSDGLVVMTEPLGPDPVPPPEDFAFRIYPNPVYTTSVLSMEFQMPLSGTASVNLYDMTGRLMTVLPPYNLSPGVQTLNWCPCDDGDDVPVGIYFLEVRVGGQRFTEELVILR